METRRKIAKNTLEGIKDIFQGIVSEERGVPKLVVSSEKGNGKVECVCLEKGLQVLEFDITVTRDTTLSLDQTDAETIFFLYCLEGNCFQKFRDNDVVNRLGTFYTGVVFSEKGMNNEFVIEKDKNLVFNVIRINKSVFLGKNDQELMRSDKDFAKLLLSFESKNGFFHFGKINLEIGELIKLLEKAKYVQDVSTLLQFKGISQLILAKQIEQYKQQVNHPEKPQHSLLKREMGWAIETGEYIKQNPEIQHTVTSLCKKSGLSPTKLQQGFKFLYNLTVGEFVRNERLKRAEHLIRTSDYNISEVVYSVGLTSRSYFCKIFKLKYGCSPKTYKKQVAGMQVIKNL